MDRSKKILLRDFLRITALTALVVCGMVVYKNWINRSEAVRAMESIGKAVVEYRTTQGYAPSGEWVKNLRESFRGNVRLGNLICRSLWISHDSSPDEIFAYTDRAYGVFFNRDFIVLRLNGKVDLITEQELKDQLAKIQSPAEIHSIKPKN